MFCNQCGTQIEDGVAFCSNCGAKVAPAAPQEQTPVAAAPQQTMGWFKFLIYFSVFAGAVLNLVTGIQLLTGSVYGDSAALVYAVFDGLKGLDTVVGIASLAVAALGVYTRFQLSGYKKNGPKLLTALYAAALAVSLIYVIGINATLPELVVKNVDMTSMYVSMVTSVVMMVVNHIYFKKRADMFVK